MRASFIDAIIFVRGSAAMPSNAGSCAGGSSAGGAAYVDYSNLTLSNADVHDCTITSPLRRHSTKTRGRARKDPPPDMKPADEPEKPWLLLHEGQLYLYLQLIKLLLEIKYAI